MNESYTACADSFSNILSNEFCTSAYRHNKQMATAQRDAVIHLSTAVYQYYAGNFRN